MMQGSLWNLNSCTINYHIMMQGSLWNLNNCTIRSKITSHFFAFKTIAGCCVNKWYWLFFCRTAALCNIYPAKIRESAVTFANHVVVVLQKCHWYVNSTCIFVWCFVQADEGKEIGKHTRGDFTISLVSVSMYNLLTVPCLSVVWKIRI